MGEDEKDVAPEESATGAMPEAAVLPQQARGAADLQPQSLDMLVALDEPERLVFELTSAADRMSRVSGRQRAWTVILGHLHWARLELDKLNR
jgi:hypothetical protein